MGALLLSWTATGVHTNIKFADELPASSPAMQALNFTEKHFTGALPFDVAFEGPRNLIEGPDALRALSKISNYIENASLPFSAFSYADIFEELGRIFSPTDKSEQLFEWSDEKIAQIQLLMDMGDAEQLEEGRTRFYSKDGSIVYRPRCDVGSDFAI